MSANISITLSGRLFDPLCDPYLRFVQYPCRKVVWCTRSFHDWFEKFVKTGKVTVEKPADAVIYPYMWALNVANLAPGGVVKIRYTFPTTVKVVTVVWAQENYRTDVEHGLRLIKDDQNYLEVRLHNDGTYQYIDVVKVIDGTATTIKSVSFAFGPGFWIPLVLWASAADSSTYPNGYYHLDGFENHYPDAPSLWELAPKHLGFGNLDPALDGFTAVEFFKENKSTDTVSGDVIQISPLTPHPFYLGYEETIDTA